MDRNQTDKILELLEVVFASFPSQNGADSGMAIKGCMMALDGRSYEAASQVLKAIITGRQPGFEGRFAPTSAEIGKWTRDADEQIMRAEAQSYAPQYIIYRAGEKPPQGYVSLSEYDDKVRAHQFQTALDCKPAGGFDE